MARQVEKGISYFPMDTGLFGDRKIRRLLNTFGPKGLTLYVFVLCEVYKDEGYFVVCDDDFFADCAYSLNYNENVVREVVTFCVGNGLFDKRVFDVEHVLTSAGIQKRYLKVKARSNVAIDERYKVCDAEKDNAAAGKDIPAAKKDYPAAEIATKEKKRKEKKKEEKEEAETDPGSPPPPTDFSVLPTYQQSIPVDTLIEEFRGESVFRDYCRMQNSLSDDDLDGYFEKFRLFLHATDEHRKRRKDCKTHFLNWLRIQMAQEAKQEPDSGTAPTGEPTESQIARVRQLYPENNCYSETLYRNYIREHRLSPETALDHFERAHRQGLTYGKVIYKVQIDHSLLFEN